MKESGAITSDVFSNMVQRQIGGSEIEENVSHVAHTARAHPKINGVKFSAISSTALDSLIPRTKSPPISSSATLLVPVGVRRVLQGAVLVGHVWRLLEFKLLSAESCSAISRRELGEI
jgi:hypothetical protein